MLYLLKKSDKLVAAVLSTCVKLLDCSLHLLKILELDDIKTHHCQIQACSAVTGEQLLDGIDWMTTDISSRIFTMD